MPIQGFDELMLQLGGELKIDSLDIKIENIAEKRVIKYREQVENINKNESKTIDEETLKAIDKITSTEKETWWTYELLVQREKDNNEKNEIYLKGIAKFPKSFELQGDYANFLNNIINDSSEAEKYYKKALDLNPENANFNGNYANFISGNNSISAEKYYKKALKLNPKEANFSGNYAKFLIETQRKDKAISFIDKAFKLNNSIQNDLILELWIYRFTIFYKKYSQSKKEIEKLLDDGIRSIGWNFDKILEMAKEEKHPEYKLLVEFVNKATTI